MLRPFALHRPSSLPDVADLLATCGRDAALYAGGTELLVLLKEGIVHAGHLIDVKRVPTLGEIAVEDGAIVIGATVTHRVVERSTVLGALCPIVPAVARHVANVRVRNVGTVGGNLAFADPHSDLATLFLTLDGTVRLWRQGAEREVPLSDFIRGPYETVREEDEILTAVRLHPRPNSTVSAYVKFGMYERPTLGVAVALTLDANQRVADARMAVGCVGPRPLRFVELEALACGREVTELLADAGRVASAAPALVEPVDDLHGSADYKRDMTRVFLRRAIERVCARALGRPAPAPYPHTIVVSAGEVAA